jgi:NitT/TauT family transport system substrate-binding protein
MGMSALEALRGGRIDAVNLFDAAHETMAAQGGVAIRRLETPEKYLSLISNSFNAHDDTIKSRSGALAGFGRAWAKGLVACYANPRACVNAFYSRRPGAKPGAASPEQAMSEALRILESRSRSYFDGDPRSPQRFGEFDRKSFQNYVAILHSQGVLQTANVPVDELYTNELVPEFNKFEREAVRKQAAALR